MKEIFIKRLKEKGINFDEGEANYIDDSFQSVYEVAVISAFEFLLIELDKKQFEKEQEYLKAVLKSMESLEGRFPLGGVFHNISTTNAPYPL